MSIHIGRRRLGAVGGALVALCAIGAMGPEPVTAEGATSVPSVIVPLDPTRVLDTRTGVGAAAGAVQPGQVISLQVTGVGGVPAGATGVVLNLTVNDAHGAGYVSAYPAGATRPEASVINYREGADIANMVTASLGASGALDLYNAQGTVHLIADVAGYLVPGSGAAGPMGPQGTAGPGPIRIEVSQPLGQGRTIGTFHGVSIFVQCQPTQTYMSFDATTGNGLRLGGTHTQGTVMAAIDAPAVASMILTKANPAGPLHYSGLIQEATDIPMQAEVHMTAGNPCRVWGALIPLG